MLQLNMYLNLQFGGIFFNYLTLLETRNLKCYKYIVTISWRDGFSSHHHQADLGNSWMMIFDFVCHGNDM